MTDFTQQQETITWHKADNELPAPSNNYLVQYKKGGVFIIDVATAFRSTSGNYRWILKRGVKGKVVHYWAELPKGWKEE